MTRLLSACFLMACLALPASALASPITYTSTHGVGTGTVNLSITTDGTIGVLNTGNIVDWLITVTFSSNTFTLRGPNSGNNSQFVVAGTAFSGSSTNLIFDTSVAGFNWAMAQNPFVGSDGPFWCVQTNQCFDFLGPGEGIGPVDAETFARAAKEGRYIVANAQTAVPEPATLSLLALGGAAIALRLRRYRRSA